MQWDLTKIFINKDEFEQSCKNTQNLAQNFCLNFQNRLSTLSVENFSLCINQYEKILSNIAKIEAYAFLHFALDSKKGAFYAKTQEICTKINENLIFFEIEFNQLSNEEQNYFISQTPKFSYYLSNLKKKKAHQLSISEEKIWRKSKNVGIYAFSRLYDEFFANLKFKFDKKMLNQEQILSKLHDKNRKVRKNAATVFSKILSKNQKLLTFIFNIVKQDANIECEIRNYDKTEDIMHEYNQISRKSVDNIIEVAENSFYLVSEFYDKKRKILGYAKLYDFDRYAPLGKESKISLKKAQNLVLKTFENFSPNFATIAKNALENGFVDVRVKSGKMGGAFCYGITNDTGPYVLLNFTKTRRDIFTMAHELGHLIHQSLTNQVGFINSQTPLTTAETASVFCEMLLFDYLKDKVGKKEKLSLYCAKIEDIFATLYRQINFTTFERRIHAHKDELCTNEINQIWREESKKMFGKSLQLNAYYDLWWSYISHFIHSPFYCYSYAYAQLLVLALFGLYKQKTCQNFIQIYTEFLSLGGSLSPKDLVMKFGFDIEKADFWQIGINEIKNLVNEFKRI